MSLERSVDYVFDLPRSVIFYPVPKMVNLQKQKIPKTQSHSVLSRIQLKSVVPIKTSPSPSTRMRHQLPNFIGQGYISYGFSFTQGRPAVNAFPGAQLHCIDVVIANYVISWLL